MIDVDAQRRTSLRAPTPNPAEEPRLSPGPCPGPRVFLVETSLGGTRDTPAQAGRSRGQHRRDGRRPHQAPISAWDRAVDEFGVAWQLSAEERVVLHATLNAPTRRLDSLVRELLAEAAGLALESGNPDIAAWCYAACERVTRDAAARPTWDEIGCERTLLARLTPAVVHGLTGESLVWWCVRLVPRTPEETSDAARQRTTACALCLTVLVAQAFTKEDAVGRERAGLAAALGVVVARRSRTAWAAT